jgi:hypothetical protein
MNSPLGRITDREPGVWHGVWITLPSTPNLLRSNSSTMSMSGFTGDAVGGPRPVFLLIRISTLVRTKSGQHATMSSLSPYLSFLARFLH